jgi:hypothetical protein
VRPSEHLHRLGELGVTGHLPVVLAVGAHEIGQDLGISRVGLGPGDGVAVPVPGRPPTG